MLTQQRAVSIKVTTAGFGAVVPQLVLPNAASQRTKTGLHRLRIVLFEISTVMSVKSAPKMRIN